jgi:plastocyanin
MPPEQPTQPNPKSGFPKRRLIIGAVVVCLVSGGAYGAYRVLTQPVAIEQTKEIAATATPTPDEVHTPLATPEPSTVPTVSPTAAPTAAPTPKPTAIPTAAPTAAPTAPPTPGPITYTVSFNGTAYSPSTVTLKAGDTVLFVNNSNSTNMWPASNPHPQHTGYPGFDPTSQIAPGATWSFKFNNAGSWGYHDHLQSFITGTVNVN